MSTASVSTDVDEIGVCKVATIGDAYMVVAGHEAKSEHDHAQRVLSMAKRMIEIVSNMRLPNGQPLQIRVGMHTGPAYAGVIGTKCPRYCFFGDTVNTASRMESNGFPMTIHCSESTHDEITGMLPPLGCYPTADPHPLLPLLPLLPLRLYPYNRCWCCC